ncbi:MAG: ADP-ribosylglycohydrolase family protein, partial [Hyphomicrobiales bacterium]
ELGTINYYVNERRDTALRSTQLVVTDDDVSGTFAFARALADYGYRRDLTAEEIGDSWLNYIVEERSILWWGGLGNSTEHTAYLRLKAGIPAPRSGSIALNGKTVAEQIGAQIFIDGWALVCPGDPEQAAYFAGQAGSVSHDGEAVHAAKLLAAMEAQAFVEGDVDKLIETGLRFVPRDCTIRRVVEDVRGWHAGDNARDWRATRGRIAERYGYDKFAGNCHVVPNHALIILATLYGRDSFQEALSIVNTAGWDTDCNAGNVGCLFGIKDGLAAIDAGPDWRGPIADRMYISAADGGGAITDAVIEAETLIRAGHAVAGQPAPRAPKGGARFSFAFPGSLQGFRSEPGDPSLVQPIDLENVAGHSAAGDRSLAIRFRGLAPGRVARAATRTFFDQEVFGMRTYKLTCSPTLYSGQDVELRVEADRGNTGSVRASVYINCFGAHDRIEPMRGAETELAPGGDCVLLWRVPDTGGRPIYEIGLEIEGIEPLAVAGAVYLDYLGWSGAPDIVLRRPDAPGEMWTHAFVNDASHFQTRWEALRVSQDEGLGMIIQGTREWRDYEVSAELTPRMAKSWGLGARVQGRRRYYALIFDAASGEGGGSVRLVRRRGAEATLAAGDFAWKVDEPYPLRLRVVGAQITASVGDRVILQASDAGAEALAGGGVALLVDTGSVATQAVAVRPAG